MVPGLRLPFMEVIHSGILDPFLLDLKAFHATSVLKVRGN